MNKGMQFCQSCGMPLTEELLGTKPMTKEEYVQMMHGVFPMLKRWKNK